VVAGCTKQAGRGSAESSVAIKLAITSIKRMANYLVPENAPEEHKKMCELFNSDLNKRELFRAAFTLYQASLERKALNISKGVVQSGIFQGISLYPKSMGSQLLPKIFGTYEVEVQDLIERKIKGINGFIDIGCAEGFYVAGIAAKYGVRSTGVDINPESRGAIEQIARTNQLDKLINYKDTIEEAFENHEGYLMILIDVDGSEKEAIRNVNQAVEKHKAINHATLIVESDFDKRSNAPNTAELVSLLSSLGWNTTEIVPQQPYLRFTSRNRNLSFLDQVILGAEGRPGEQVWICAEKATD
jgi:hypothetical protein